MSNMQAERSRERIGTDSQLATVRLRSVEVAPLSTVHVSST